MHPGPDFTDTPITPERVLEALGWGEAEARTARALVARLTGRQRAADERRLRALVVALRRAGYPVCAHPATGYYLAASDAELDRTCEFLYSRAMTSLTQISAMRRVALPDLRGQLGLTMRTDS